MKKTINLALVIVLAGIAAGLVGGATFFCAHSYSQRREAEKALKASHEASQRLIEDNDRKESWKTSAKR